MANSSFVLGLALVYFPLVLWLARRLPGERWQIMAAIPVAREGSGWQGRNLTFYGLLTAAAIMLGVSIFLLLLAAVGMPLWRGLALVSAIGGAAVIASGVVARVVEGKKNTFTVAGGAAVGLYLTPPVVWLFERGFGTGIGMMPVLAALAVAYILGEGVGRLACLSFGCCYGKPLSQLGPRLRRLFAPFACAYQGETKKIVYASGLAGEPVAPIQALTSLLYGGMGLAGIYLFLEGRFAAAFGLTAIFALAWRILSEQLRADFRGESKLTAYQRLGLINIICCLALLRLLPAPAAPLPVDLTVGLAVLWQPGLLLLLQGLWLALFLHFGLSRVTAATLAFHVRRDQV